MNYMKWFNDFSGSWEFFVYKHVQQIFEQIRKQYWNDFDDHLKGLSILNIGKKREKTNGKFPCFIRRNIFNKKENPSLRMQNDEKSNPISFYWCFVCLYRIVQAFNAPKELAIINQHKAELNPVRSMLCYAAKLRSRK